MAVVDYEVTNGMAIVTLNRPVEGPTALLQERTPEFEGR